MMFGASRRLSIPQIVTGFWRQVAPLELSLDFFPKEEFSINLVWSFSLRNPFRISNALRIHLNASCL